MTDRDILKTGMVKRAGFSRILTGIPGIGGALHGAIDPVEGSPRGTSVFYEGLGGGLGSILGGTAGSLAFRGGGGKPGLAGLLGGGVLGSVLGSGAGRWLAETQEDSELEELRKLISQVRPDGMGGVTVNVGGPTAAAAANRNKVEHPKVEVEEITVEEDGEEEL